MIGGRVDSVGTDNIGAQLHEIGNISLTTRRICQRVDVVRAGAATGAVTAVVLCRMDLISAGLWHTQADEGQPVSRTL